ncbi:shewanella-like protein phosphatase [Polyangium sorediatum]|uniref:Shewanella-like protein phosphatase n=1 Tax=Polyangium sorediatum TaxID=889274 RepID=A0ABT6P2C0_9BACT|nr:shewanella-like protein phosphatase [Polyangium sorediatum]MDI1434703.1 shewanella-like protein phosphatase [Polyangium sorediatum]
MHARIPSLAVAVVALALTACDKPIPESTPAKPPAAAGPQASPGAAPSASAQAAFEQPKRIAAPARIVAIGDVHGDLAATRTALRTAGAIDEKDHWIGKDLMVVQTGDEIDRGDADREIVDLFERLADEAKAAGGAVIAMNGNHEVMNVQLDLRYVTDGSFKDFEGVPGITTTDPRLARVPENEKARAAAFLPGGPYAKKLAKRGIVAVVGDTVFVHGGISPKHVRYGLDRMNREVSAWMDGTARDLPGLITAEDGPVWLRRYSAAPGPDDCRVLAETLTMLSAKRMVVGHTPQRGGITSACGEQVWRIDVGMSKHYGGKPEVLEIKGAEVRPIRAEP